MKYKSTMAQAWELAAAWVDQARQHDFDVEENVRLHLIQSVIPHLRRRAEIVERNYKQGVRAPGRKRP